MLHAALRIIRESRARAAAEEAARRALEEKLMQSRRLETVGRLAAGVAHDFNNVLTVVFAEVSRLTRMGDDKIKASAGNIKEAAEHAAALTRQLMSFGRQQVRRPELLDLAQVTTQLERLLGKFVGDRIQFAIEPGDGVPPVRADRTEVEQVLLNLVTNARDAMPDGGALTVRTGVATAEMRARCPGIAGEPAVYLSVSDTGTGIAPEVRSRLFEPFFTTKEIGKGTGLGLATVQAIAGSAGGVIPPNATLPEGEREGLGPVVGAVELRALGAVHPEPAGVVHDAGLARPGLCARARPGVLVRKSARGRGHRHGGILSAPRRSLTGVGEPSAELSPPAMGMAL
ncbi:MAG: hypothetical protein F9K40_08880 [Kofleriaceae bacterium]|nr:MAG: hypothetical protein F9K40_08880 [Kofleriaceae bacterium]